MNHKDHKGKTHSKENKHNQNKEIFVNRHFESIWKDLSEQKGNNLNFSLLLEKFIPLSEKDGNIVFDNRVKKDFFKKISKLSIKKEDFDRLPFYKDIDNICNGLKNQGYLKIFDKELKTKTRLICGLGSSSVLETSITLHRTYGIPYIPSTSIKGVCRSVAFWKIFEKYGLKDGNYSDEKFKTLSEKFNDQLIEVKDEGDLEIQFYQLLFGAQDFKGLLLFLDAFPLINQNPINQNLFDIDVMNVHYPSYYSEQKKYPSESDNPNPIFFITVKKGIGFRFVVFFDRHRWDNIKSKIKNKSNNNLSDDEIWKKIDHKTVEKVDDFIKEGEEKEGSIKQLLEKALGFYGVGSKTRLSYGLFTVGQ